MDGVNVMNKPKYLTKISQIDQLTADEQDELQEVSKRFAFRSNKYYQDLIDWDDPNDPIRRIVVPIKEELESWGQLDASDEVTYTVVPGLEHKYGDTALMLVNDVCGAYCRFCFRKRLFMNDNDEVVHDVSKGLEYIREHKEITNVLLSGGDPFILSTERLANILRGLREISHVRIIRIGTKIPAFSPDRILNDPELLEAIRRYSTAERRIYVMAHFNHIRELTDSAIKGLDLLQRAGAILTNQTPLIRGVNDTPEALLSLLNCLSFIGVPPYYIFQCRPTLGNKAYSVPLEEAFDIFLKAQAHSSGLAKRARFVMSHATGKIEVVGMTDEVIVMRYHQAADPNGHGKLLIFKRNPNAHWLDDYEEAASEVVNVETVKLYHIQSQ